jgi:hypothetical protein
MPDPTQDSRRGEEEDEEEEEDTEEPVRHKNHWN